MTERRTWTAWALLGATLAAAAPAFAAHAGAATAPPGEQLVVGPECHEVAGATLIHLPDVTIPAVEVAAVVTPDATIDGVAVPGVVVAGFTIPAQVIDAGCIIAYDAPAGCVGAVAVTAAAIPSVTIPASVIPAVELASGHVVAEVDIPAVTIPGVAAPAVRTEQVCQVELGGELPTVSRPGVVRMELSRPGGARPGTSRPRRCGDVGCLPEVRVEAVRVERVQLPDVDIDPVRLESQDLAEGVDVLRGGDEITYVAPGDVLFDTDQATIRPEAAAALWVIAAAIVDGSAPTAPIRVEGHTDDRGTVEHNRALSQRRAEAVADWLVTDAGIDPARLVVVGRGESAPAAPNDSDANRQLNRRVVVAVAAP
jgi:outer membrane protein OmpA-like peptidoglycan-associated protein